jgi:hypothetical protein
MTARETSSSAPSITDPETLRDRPNVPFHEDSDVVDGTTFDAVRELDDAAVAGVTNDDAVLLIRTTETDPFRLPTADVEADDDYTEQAAQWIESQAGLAADLDSVAAVWQYDVRLEDSGRTASRTFVVYRGTPATDDETLDPGPDGAADAGWFDELPADVDEVPGTNLFFD